MPSRYLEVEGLACVADGRLLFQALSFSLEQGGVATVRGANGSGKSCLLQSLCGVAQQGVQTRGRVRCLSHPIAFADVASLSMLIGHSAPFLKALSLFDNLVFWATVFSPRAYKQNLSRAAYLFALEDFWHTPLARLSAGERQRGALALLALKPQARLWLLDEPQAALDAHAKQRLYRCLLAYLERGGTIVIASHEKLPASLQRKVRCNLTLGREKTQRKVG